MKLTQEEFASRIGVSAQSVSNWERGTSYPDITLLPVISNILGISVDELLGVGVLTDEEILDELKQKARKATEPNELKDLLLSYCHSYPNNFKVIEWTIWIIYRELSEYDEMRSFALTLGRRILSECTDINCRITAHKVLSFISDDEDAHEYIDTFNESILLRPNIIGRHMWNKSKREDARSMFDIEMICIFDYIFGRAFYCDDVPESAVKYCGFLEDILLCLGDGNVPDGWLGHYGITLTRHSAALFASGNRTEGYQKLQSALNVYEKWYSHPAGRKLDVGRLCVSGNVKISRNEPNRSIYMGDELYPYSKIHVPDVTELLTTLSWFDSVKNEAKFKDITRRISEISKTV